VSVPRVLAAIVLIVQPLAAPVGANAPLEVSEPAEVTALAVAREQDGDVVGVNATIETRVATNGSGHVFMDTRPLAGTDLQGSARIASRVAGSLTGHSLEANDFFYVIRSDSPLLSGPSAGSVMALAASVALHNAHAQNPQDRWNIREDVMATGTVGPDGSIGPVGGILEKARSAAQAGASTFVIPQGQGNYTPRLPGGQVQTNETVNVADHCREKLNITCTEVGRIERLAEIATGETLPQPELGEPPTTAEYGDLLEPRTHRLLENATHVYETWGQMNQSSVPASAESRIAQAINQSVNAFNRASSHFEADRYYKAASEAFESSIRGRYAQLLLTFHQQNRQLGFVEDQIRTASDVVQNARDEARGRTVTGMNTLYTVGAGQARAIEAKTHLDDARNALQQQSARTALFQAAWAIERAGTVSWWLELGTAIGPGPDLPVTTQALADEFVNLASEVVVYSGSVLGNQQGPDRTRERLDQAKQHQNRGFHAAAVTEALKAQVLAQMAIEVREDEPDPEKVNQSRRQAELAIQRARGAGVEPVFPIAQFEFATTAPQASVALEFYRTANVLAGLSEILTGNPTEPTSRFIDPAPESQGHVAIPKGLQAAKLQAAGVGVFAALAGVALVLALKRSRSEA
jgi:uncharacterized protein